MKTMIGSVVRLGTWLTLGSLALACSPEVTAVDDDDGANGGGGAGTGGQAAGGDGTGGASLCATDCAAITAPVCHVALCNDGQYPGPVGSCVIVPDEGASCDDGAFCTIGDTCQAGVCLGGPPNDCGMSPGACDVVTCNEATKSCSNTPAANGASCTPTDLCEVGAVCANGLCVGQLKDCFFAPVPDECHVAECNPANGMCEPTPGNEGGTCTDLSDLCTVNKTCTAGTCGGGMPKNCSGLTQGCNIGTCDTTTGQCTAVAVPDGALCDDLNACTTGELCSLGNCSGGTTTTSCSDNDDCCPAGCTDLTDNDCGNDVLIVHGESSVSTAQDVQTKLQAFNVFPVVDLFAAHSATPTLSQLQAYDVLLVWSNSPFQNPVALGDVIADFYDAGGRVVTSTFSMCSGYALGGRWGDPAQGYVFITTAPQQQPSDSIGTILEPASPLMNGVSLLNASSAYRCPGTLINGAVAVAQWSNGAHPLVVRGVVQGRNRADVNIYPPSNDVVSGYWTGHGAELLRNALLYK